MPELLIQKIGPDQYTVTDATGAGREAKAADLKTFSWDDLCAYILKETPFPSRIFPTLKTNLESGQLWPLRFPEGSDDDPANSG